MDDRTRATVRALLERHPRGYAAESGITVTGTAAGLFRLLCLAILSDGSVVPSQVVADGALALFERHWDSAPEVAKTDERERADALREAGHPDPHGAARNLGGATRMVLDRYDGDLGRLRVDGRGDRRRIRELLAEISGMQDAGVVVFMRDAQMLWPELAPCADEHATRAASRLDLPADPEALMRDVARGTRHEQLAWIVGALALVDRDGEHDRIVRAAAA